MDRPDGQDFGVCIERLLTASTVGIPAYAGRTVGAASTVGIPAYAGMTVGAASTVGIPAYAGRTVGAASTVGIPAYAGRTVGGRQYRRDSRLRGNDGGGWLE